MRAEPLYEDEQADVAAFNEHRSLVFSIAYRMLGSVTDAEDLVQDAFIRWLQRKDREVNNTRSYLVTIISRLCLNHLNLARVQREQYVGQWLPEPMMTDRESDPLGVLRLDESLSIALLTLLQRLSPTERAVFILREVFNYKYSEIAATLGQSEANCRQIFHRAQQHVGSVRQRFQASAREHTLLMERFLAASRNGDMTGLVHLLSSDVALQSDGGGKAIAAPNIVRGATNVARVLVHGLARVLPQDLTFKTAWINGQTGVITYSGDTPFSVLILDVREARVHGVYIVTNPDKLSRIPAL